MIVSATSRGPALGATALKLLQGVIALIVVARLVLLLFAKPFMDEAYYFMWGQHPAISYFDHPSLVGWTQGLSAAILGWNVVALRFPLLLTQLADVFLLYLFARRLGGEDWRPRFWATLALFLTMPIFALITTFTLPDHLLLTFTLAAIYFLQGFFGTFDAGAPRWRLLYAGAAAIGLALLSKYYGALVGLGLGLTVLLVPRYRPLLGRPHLYGAALLALAIQTPSIVWNVQHHFASFSFIVFGRQGLANPMQLRGLIGYLLGIAAMVSPFLLWALFRFATDRKAVSTRVAQAVFWTSTVAFLAASLRTNIIVHWNMIAYVAALPFLIGYIRSRVLFWAQMVFGVLAVAFIGFNYAVLPWGAALGGIADQTSAWGYGSDEVAARIRQIEATEPIAFVAGTDYTIASEVAWGMQDRNVTSLSFRRDAYDDWFDAEARRGSSAIIVADRWRAINDIGNTFATLEDAGSVEVVRFGKLVNTYRLYIGRGFIPPTPDESQADHND